MKGLAENVFSGLGLIVLEVCTSFLWAKHPHVANQVGDAGVQLLVIDGLFQQERDFHIYAPFSHFTIFDHTLNILNPSAFYVVQT